MALPSHIDPEILNDFLTESLELLEVLDRDLVTLETQPEDPELLNRIFRALHTIKGSASFLGLTNLTGFAHAAEDALNAARKGQVRVTAEIMDTLLESSDVLRRQLDRLAEQDEPEAAPPQLVERLHRIGEGQAPSAATPAPSPAPVSLTPATAPEPQAAGRLDLSSSKLDLLPYMVEDLLESIVQIRGLLAQIEGEEDLTRIATQLTDVTEGLERSVEFFEIDALCREVQALGAFAQTLTRIKPADRDPARRRVEALLQILSDRADALREQKLLSIHTEVLIERLTQHLVGQALEQTAMLAENATLEDVLRIDGVRGDQPAAATEATPAADATRDGAPGAVAPSGPAANDTAAEARDGEARKSHVEQTIRVDVERLESLLNLVGELVLQKNRVSAMARRLGEGAADHDTSESFQQVASDLDRVTSELQLGVMKTRMQPLSKLFDRYPRLIRDLARSTDKQIDLTILGGETEVDKSVLELLGDPLVHILRNSADHGIEPPAEREAAGKPARGEITIDAGHEGNHVVVRISDNGRGLNAERIGARAVERGLISAEELAQLPLENIYKFIFAPGFSTAEQVSNISGRGVGMDVVKTNITRMNGLVDVESTEGAGTTVSIKIPLTVAIMQAMMVGVGDAHYAVPLNNILEIVKPREQVVSSVNGHLVMRLRNTVLPLIDLGEVFENPTAETPPYAVIVGLGNDRVGMLVHELVGQEEVVIKPLDGIFDRSELVSGATVREDGGVSLILDVGAIIRAANQNSLQGRAFAAARNRARSGSQTGQIAVE